MFKKGAEKHPVGDFSDINVYDGDVALSPSFFLFDSAVGPLSMLGALSLAPWSSVVRPLPPFLRDLANYGWTRSSSSFLSSDNESSMWINMSSLCRARKKGGGYTSSSSSFFQRQLTRARAAKKQYRPRMHSKRYNLSNFNQWKRFCEGCTFLYEDLLLFSCFHTACNFRCPSIWKMI